jgi:hypothetical protein
MKGILLVLVSVLSLSINATFINLTCDYANPEKEGFVIDFNSELSNIDVRNHTLYFPTTGTKKEADINFTTGVSDYDSSIAVNINNKEIKLSNIRLYEIRLAGVHGNTYTFSANYEINEDSEDNMHCKMFFWSL